MVKQLLVALVSAFAVIGSVQAASDCESRAVSKEGKPLAGAAKTSFVQKCEKETIESGRSACEAKAMSKDGKPLAGAAKASSVQKCMAESK